MIDLNPNVGSKNIVPFGKYKGQPVETLAQDKPYLEWLSSQDWFRERYSGIYTLIVNNFTEPSETPEHNSLQVLFLDDEFCFSFLKATSAQWMAELKAKPLQIAREKIAAKLQYIEHEYDEAIKRSISKDNPYLRDSAQRLAKESAEMRRLLDAIPLELTYSVRWVKEFELKGIDVMLTCNVKSLEQIPNTYDLKLLWNNEDFKHFEIEIKPAVGDDYPAILRQMKASKSKYLFTQRYTGVGATKDQFVQTMKLSGITVVFQDDLQLENKSISS